MPCTTYLRQSDEVKGHRDEMKVVRAQLHKFNGLLCTLQDKVRRLTSSVRPANEDSVYSLCQYFSLPYKVARTSALALDSD